MNLIIRLLLNALAVFVLAHILNGVTVDGYVGAVLVILTLPVTILTLGLFLLVINALIILLADKLIDGFGVASFWTALLFSILLSILQSLLQSIFKEDKK